MISNTPPPSKSRQPVYGKAAVSSSHPLATTYGLEVLSKGGSAADACITVASVLAVTEPTFNGIGGDFICLHYDNKSKETTSFLGIGKSPKDLTHGMYTEQIPVPTYSPHSITVPGVIAGWFDLKERFGNSELSMYDLLKPSIELAKNGFYVQRTAAYCWQESEDYLKLVQPENNPFLPAPKMGDLFTNIELSNTLYNVAMNGKDEFYGKEGFVAQQIIKCIQDKKGVMKMDDLINHETLITKPLSVEYRDWKIMEPGAPTHGVITLLAMNILSEIENYHGDLSESERYHYLIESIRLSFIEGSQRIGDSVEGNELVHDMTTNKELARSLSKRIIKNKKHDISDLQQDKLSSLKGGTVQFSIIDKDGNSVSAVQTNYQGFGTGLVPAQCGFTLQNRGLNFNYSNANHVNYIEGGKRPYHTIMPGFMMNLSNNDIVSFGVMGSFMQPQGHLLVATSFIDKSFNCQEVLDLPRFRVTGEFSAVESGMGNDEVLIEADMEETQLVEDLKQMGHACRVAKMSSFGRGHVCWRRASDGRVEAGADSRADGVALALL